MSGIEGPDGPERYCRSVVKSDRDDSMHICSAVRYSGEDASAASSGRFMAMMASLRRIVRRRLWNGAIMDVESALPSSGSTG
jgi:hypothetical protein